MIFSCLSISKESLEMLILCVISLFFIVAFTPLFKKRENLWMFVMVTFASLPVNLFAIYYMVSEDVFDYGFALGNISWYIMVFYTLFSLEQIGFAAITKLIWRKQYKLDI